MYIVDTNILIDSPQIVEDKNMDLIIPTSVLKELDGLKKHVNNEIAKKARRAAIYLSRNIDTITWYDTSKMENEKIPVDDQLLKLGELTESTVLTNDVYLKIKCHISNVKTSGFSIKDNYDGIVYWYLNATDPDNYDVLEKLLQEGKIPEWLEKEVFENTFLILKDPETEETMGVFIYKDNKMEKIGEKKIRNRWINQIRPKNPEQLCLFEALNNTENKIIYAGGVPGGGKSFIVNNYALQELEKEEIKKIVYIPNNSYVEDAMELGYLPGSDIEKTIPGIGPLIDLVGLDHVNRMLSEETLEIVPLGYIRGRSFQDSIIIVNEAQNLTESHLKLLISRCGDGTRIFFDGDIKQADSQLFRNKNGLKLLMSLRKSPIYSKIFAAVALVSIERSITAQAADYLDNV